MRPASLLRRFGALVGAAAIVLAAWPTPFVGNGGDPAVVLPSAASTAGPAHSANGTSAPGSPMPTEDLGRPAFAEECTRDLQPEWRPMFGKGDPGFGLDSDFLGSLRQVSVDDGVCTITAARADTPSGRPYASAAISTRRAFSQRYGTFEIRVRYSAGQGLWPAFWLVEDVDPGTEPFEVDVFEAYPGHSSGSAASGPTQVASTLHFPGGRHTFGHDHGSDLTTDFHTHRMTWSPGLMVFAIDGVETGRITRDVPDVPMYPVVNLAVGASGYRIDDTTPYVALMEIDYIRIWAP